MTPRTAIVATLMLAGLSACSTTTEPAGSTETDTLATVSETVADTVEPDAGTTEPATTATEPAVTETTSATATWSLTTPQPIGIDGVSPELVRTTDGTMLLLATGIPGGAYTSSDGTTFTKDTTTQLPPGSDYTLVERNGTWNLYYVDMAQQPKPGTPPDPATSMKTVKVASTTDGHTFTPGIETGVKQNKPGKAWGVPDTYILPDGKTAMMYVDRPEGTREEVLMLATSTDGTTFTVNPDPVIVGGYVDPNVFQMEDGTYIALLSTGPGQGAQRIHIATSPDGTTWNVNPDPLLESATTSYLDPAAVDNKDGTWTVVLATANLGGITDPSMLEYKLAVATLTHTNS